MQALTFFNGHVVLPNSVVRGARIQLSGQRIGSIEPHDGRIEGAIDLEGGWLMPGFIDTQVNGGGGVLFNDDISVDAIATIGAAHARFGTTGFLPTLISDTLPAVSKALDAVDRAIDDGVPGVLGVHLEGPFLNPSRKGVHDDAHFRTLDDRVLDLLCRPRRGLVMMTLAPELCRKGDIARLVASGVRVAAGHTDATYSQIVEAMDEGLDGITHLYNAMSPLHHRDLGVVGAALDDGRAWCGLIADGAHVLPAAIRIAMHLLPADKLMLVTDAMPSVGAEQKDFILQGKAISVADGICLGPDAQLAGSDLDMTRAVSNIVTLAGARPDEAARMASANPAAFLRVESDRGKLRPGARADLVMLDARLKARMTWIGGLRASDAYERAATLRKRHISLV